MVSCVKKTLLVTLLTIYTVVCGIIIADFGAGAVAGRGREGIMTVVIMKNE